MSAAIALSLAVAGCGALDGRVDLLTAPAAFGGCIATYEVVDVIADADHGTVVQQGGWPLRWPTGFTGQRVGSEVQVRDPEGNVVLTTGGRFRIAPAFDGTDYSPPPSTWIVGCLEPCPACDLGVDAAPDQELVTDDP